MTALPQRATPPAPTVPLAPLQSLYRALLTPRPSDAALRQARDFLRAELAQASPLPCELPADLADLEGWMRRHTDAVGTAYAEYLAQRRQGAPRRFFAHRAQALHFLRGVAPTKMADGAWLHGLVHHWHDARLHGLIQTYLEELGNGRPRRNHVLLYQALLAENGCQHWQGQPDSRYRQAAIQLALGWHAAEFLPEVIGFNLGYEQLPLHLLITVRELEELGLDPHYFRLHVTVDNAATGHARKAVEAVRQAWPILGDAGHFLRRVRNGYRLNALGEGTEDVIAAFDIDRELLRIFRAKGEFGRLAHSDRCQIAGRGINEWLQQPDQTAALIDALVREGWIAFGPDPQQSRFWRLIDGDRALMAGVFSPYEKQLLRDWITAGRSPPSPRPARATAEPAHHRGAPDADQRLLRQQLAASGDHPSAMAHLAPLLAPASHPSPVGLLATRLYRRMLHAGGGGAHAAAG